MFTLSPQIWNASGNFILKNQILISGSFYLIKFNHHPIANHAIHWTTPYCCLFPAVPAEKSWARSITSLPSHEVLVLFMQTMLRFCESPIDFCHSDHSPGQCLEPRHSQRPWRFARAARSTMGRWFSVAVDHGMGISA